MIRIENVQGTGRTIELKKLVVKLGSAVVAGEGHAPDEVALGGIADGVARLREQGVQVILVSSGAIAMGRRATPDFVPHTIPDRQALAAIGQVGLMRAYKDLFNARGFLAAQVLLTRDDMESRQRYLNARYALERLLDLGAVPVINENDTVTIDELRFGDNDELSALVATKMEADLLVILSVVDGLYEGDPTKALKKKSEIRNSKFESNESKSEILISKTGMRDSGGGPILFVEKVDEAVQAMAEASRSAAGTGGMITKLRAMQMTARAGVHGMIAGGRRTGILEQIATGRFTGTYFCPSATRRLPSRERWIAFGRRPKGEIVIDAGARQALVVGKKSLLPAGVVEVRGVFERGELIEIVDQAGICIARGLTSFSSAEIEKIKGKKTNQIEKILGSVDYQEIVHRDNLAMQG